MEATVGDMNTGDCVAVSLPVFYAVVKRRTFVKFTRKSASDALFEATHVDYGAFMRAIANRLLALGHDYMKLNPAVVNSGQFRAAAHRGTHRRGGAVVHVDVSSHGVVPGIDQATFERFAQDAKSGCIVSRALAGVPEITLEATLAG